MGEGKMERGKAERGLEKNVRKDEGEDKRNRMRGKGSRERGKEEMGNGEGKRKRRMGKGKRLREGETLHKC